jgi:hypothetical protein
MKGNWFFYLIPPYLIIAIPLIITYNNNQNRIRYENTLRSVVKCRIKQIKQSNVKDAHRFCGLIPKYSDYF